MDVTIYDPCMPGMPVKCGTGGCRNKATSSWSATVIAGGANGTQHYACDEHNPMRFTASALPSGFRSQSLCHACGQPVNVGSLPGLNVYR